MKNITKLSGKKINYFIKDKSLDFLPDYWETVIGYNEKTCRIKRVTGEFISTRYKSILRMIKETNAKVSILPDEILINYTNGSAKIQRDVFTDTFLIPLLNY